MTQRFGRWMLAVALAACSDLGDDREPIRLGVVSPLTGDLSPAGHTQQDALLLAISEINAAGGVLGRPIVPDTRDDGTTPGGTVVAYTRLLTEEVPVVIGPVWSGGVRVIAEQIRRGGTLTISDSATAPDLAELDDDGYFFRTVPSDAVQAIVLTSKIVASGCQRLCVVYRNDEYGNGLSRAVQSRLQGAVAVVESSYNPAAASLSDVMNRCDAIVKEPGAGAIFITYQSDGTVILRDAAARGWSAATHPIFFVDGNARQELWDELADVTAFEGAIGTGPSGPTPQTSAGVRRGAFRERFLARYKRQAATYAENAYDTAYLAALAIEIAGSVKDRDAIRAAMGQTSTGPAIDAGDWKDALVTIATHGQVDFRGASGEVNLDPTTGELLPPFYVRLWTLKNGRMVDTDIVTVTHE